ncbi:MAG: PstS family phosphate ABC transporter substrate-binding protein [Prochlorothrix sp.]|nr:PstS family phosphate ABC transporter substrate-binding protein [Prochlorothrix sp.]
MSSRLNLSPIQQLTAAVSCVVAATMVTFSGSMVQAQGRSTISIDGSSTVFPITEAVAEEFQNTRRNSVAVVVGISGTGGGFKRFCAGETDISNASRPIKASEMELCRQAGVQYIEVPVAYDALTVVVNPDNDWVTSLSVEDLKTMWEPAAEGQISRWNQVRSEWPNAPINLFGPGADSGTFDYFTEAINGKAQESRGDFTASEDDNVLVQGVLRDRNALGYFGFAYYENNKDRLRAVPIDNGNGPVFPSRAAVENGTYQPLSRPLFIYISTAALRRPEVREFANFYLDNADELSAEVGYVALPAEVYSAVRRNVETGKVGSVFANRETVGVNISDLLRLEAQE